MYNLVYAGLMSFNMNIWNKPYSVSLEEQRQPATTFQINNHTYTLSRKPTTDTPEINKASTT